MPEVWLELDTALKERLRRVLDDPQRPVTEAELRKLSEEGRACTLIDAAFEGRQRFFDVVATLAHERRLSRLAYTAEKPT